MSVEQDIQTVLHYLHSAAQVLRKAAHTLDTEAKDLNAEIVATERDIRKHISALKREEMQKNIEVRLADNSSQHVDRVREIAQIKAQISNDEQEFYKQRDSLITAANDKQKQSQIYLQKANELESFGL